MSDTPQDNLKIWKSWETTNPDNTKKVTEGGYQYTAINAYSQFRKATELFGPVGTGWGWTIKSHELLYADRPANTMILLALDVWITEGGKRHAIEMMNSIKLFNRSGDRIDDDAYKKLLTDTITKGLSYFGCSADVFLGLYDDNRYVQRAREAAAREAAGTATPPATAQNGSGAPNTRQTGQNANTGQNRPPTASNSGAAPPHSPKSAFFAECRAHCKALGIELSGLQAHMKHHGYQNLQEVPEHFLADLKKRLAARVAAFNVLREAAVKTFGEEDGIERLYIWLDQNAIDLMNVEPNVLLNGAKSISN